MTKRRPVLADIARELGVSAMTVSKAINDKEGVSDETRERVLAIADRIGYIPNASARRFATGTTNTIGVLIENTTAQYANEIIQGIADQLFESGHEMLVAVTYIDPERQRRQMLRLSHGLADALIAVAPVVNGDGRVLDEPLDVPLVVVDPRSVESGRFAAVSADNYAGMRAATEHLLSMGHTKIAFIGGDTTFDSAARRRQGFLDAMALAGVAVDDEWVIDAGYSHPAGFDTTTRLLQSVPRPTAVIAACDPAAYGAIDAARVADLRVPEDLSVVGFDDLPQSRSMHPALTTVRQPLSAMGEASARMALSLSRGEELVTDEVRFDTELIVRSSAVPPAE